MREWGAANNNISKKANPNKNISTWRKLRASLASDAMSLRVTVWGVREQPPDRQGPVSLCEGPPHPREKGGRHVCGCERVGMIETRLKACDWVED